MRNISVGIVSGLQYNYEDFSDISVEKVIIVDGIIIQIGNFVAGYIALPKLC